MKLAEPINRFRGEVHQLLSRGSQLLALNQREIKLVGSTDAANWPNNLGIRCMHQVADTLLLGCHKGLRRVNDSGVNEEIAANGNDFWHGWDIRCVHRYEPCGYGGVEQPMIVAAGVRRRDDCENQTLLARYVSSRREWRRIGFVVGRFKIRRLLDYQFPDERDFLPVPLMAGKGGVVCFPSIDSQPMFFDRNHMKDLRDVAIMCCDDKDLLYGVGQSGFHQYDDTQDCWECLNDTPFSTCLVEHTDATDQPVVLAAGRDSLLLDDAENCEELITWGRHLIPTALAVHQDSIFMAYQVKGEPGFTNVSEIEGYFE